MKTAEQRKADSIIKLVQHEVPYIDWLPHIEAADETVLKTKETIAKRAIACLISIQAACDRDNDSYTPESAEWCLDLIQQFELGQVLTPQEVKILNNEGDEQDVINMIWKYEAYWSLLWALGLVEQLDFPNDTVDCDYAISVVSQCDNFDAFMQSVTLRDLETVLDEADLIYRYHWACVDARINQREIPSGMIESVVSERRAGLDWLIHSDADWDNPERST